jgi:hypothetical protein
MTSTVTEVTRMIILSSNYGRLSNSLSLIVILLLVVVLAQKELMRALGSSRSKTWMRALDIAIVPLWLAFGVMVIRRLIALIFPL